MYEIVQIIRSEGKYLHYPKNDYDHKLCGVLNLFIEAEREGPYAKTRSAYSSEFYKNWWKFLCVAPNLIPFTQEHIHGESALKYSSSKVQQSRQAIKNFTVC